MPQRSVLCAHREQSDCTRSPHHSHSLMALDQGLQLHPNFQNIHWLGACCRESNCSSAGHEVGEDRVRLALAYSMRFRETSRGQKAARTTQAAVPHWGFDAADSAMVRAWSAGGTHPFCHKRARSESVVCLSTQAANAVVASVVCSALQYHMERQADQQTQNINSER